jgi:cell division initiation protein
VSLTPVDIRHVPVDIRHVRFRRRPFGYRRRSVDAELARIADSFEEVWRERADLADRVEEMERELDRHRELEGTLRRTLVSAERAVDAMRHQAQRDADAIVRDAEARARAIIGEAHAERERMRRDLLRLRATEQEFRARLRSVVTTTEHLVDEYEAELGEDAQGDAA